MGKASARERLAGWVLGPAGPVRTRTSLTLISLVVYVLFAFVQHGEVMLGLIDLTESNWLTAFNLIGTFTFYGLVRSGLSQRLSSEPSLSLPQMLFAMLSITWSYAITGPARGAVISIMIVVLMYGMFRMPARRAHGLAVLGFVMLASVMIWRSQTAPQRYALNQEMVHLFFTAIVLGAASTLAITVGRMRSRLAAQKQELREALALNRELATRDALTGLLNRRAMVELLGREHPRIERGQGPLAVALLDIDLFKRINDNLGHGVGDEVLRRFAAILKAQLRAADALARWGGEEFLLLMPGTHLDDARLVLDRLRRAVHASDEFAAVAADLKVTFSAGLVEVGEGESQDAALERADRALYQAKERGRNRIEIGEGLAEAHGA